MPKYVYQLKATGVDTLVYSIKTVYSTTVFSTRKLAEKRIELLKEKLLKDKIFSPTDYYDRPFEIKVEILQLEIVE